MIEKPGIYSVQSDTYHSDPAPCPSLSATIADILCRQSPLHAWTAHPRLNPDFEREEAATLDLGSIAHALMLEGEHIAEVLDFSDYRKDAAKEARNAARIAGKVPILKKQYDDVCRMMEAAKTQLQRYPYVFEQPGKPESTILWEEDGVWCRARLDWLADSLRWIDDYKTRSGSANPEIVSRTIFSEGWDIKAAFYIRAVQSLDPAADPQFRFVCQETYPPYAISVIALGPDVLMLAEKKVLWAIDKWRDCLRTGIWPGYPKDVCYASLPAWEETRWLEKELSDVV